jgi:hypothetical protein
MARSAAQRIQPQASRITAKSMGWTNTDSEWPAGRGEQAYKPAAVMGDECDPPAGPESSERTGVPPQGLIRSRPEVGRAQQDAVQTT